MGGACAPSHGAVLPSPKRGSSSVHHLLLGVVEVAAVLMVADQNEFLRVRPTGVIPVLHLTDRQVVEDAGGHRHNDGDARYEQADEGCQHGVSKEWPLTVGDDRRREDDRSQTDAGSPNLEEAGHPEARTPRDRECVFVVSKDDKHCDSDGRAAADQCRQDGGDNDVIVETHWSPSQ